MLTLSSVLAAPTAAVMGLDMGSERMDTSSAAGLLTLSTAVHLRPHQEPQPCVDIEPPGNGPVPTCAALRANGNCHGWKFLHDGYCSRACGVCKPRHEQKKVEAGNVVAERAAPARVAAADVTAGEAPVAAVLYSGRWVPDGYQVGVRNHVQHLFEPLEMAGYRVSICWAATASQWCSDNRTTFMPDGKPSEGADAALAGELHLAFGSRYHVTAKTFVEPEVVGVHDAMVRAAGRFADEDVTPWKQTKMESLVTQLTNLRRAHSLCTKDVVPALFVRARVDFTFEAPLVVPLLANGEDVVLAMHNGISNADPEHATPEWSDFVYIMGERCARALVDVAVPPLELVHSRQLRCALPCGSNPRMVRYLLTFVP